MPSYKHTRALPLRLLLKDLKLVCYQEQKEKEFIQIKTQNDSCASLKHITMLPTLLKIIVETDVIKPKPALLNDQNIDLQMELFFHRKQHMTNRGSLLSFPPHTQTFT